MSRTVRADRFAAAASLGVVLTPERRIVRVSGSPLRGSIRWRNAGAGSTIAGDIGCASLGATRPPVPFEFLQRRKEESTIGDQRAAFKKGIVDAYGSTEFWLIWLTGPSTLGIAYRRSRHVHSYGS
ncbi:MAG TPA: hypothetical protein PK177_08030 [Burkholderiaceae bacterium]|nr:hypothetical protein [Burkholderiaceae bacterium]